MSQVLGEYSRMRSSTSKHYIDTLNSRFLPGSWSLIKHLSHFYLSIQIHDKDSSVHDYYYYYYETEAHSSMTKETKHVDFIWAENRLIELKMQILL